MFIVSLNSFFLWTSLRAGEKLYRLKLLCFLFLFLSEAVTECFKKKYVFFYCA